MKGCARFEGLARAPPAAAACSFWSCSCWVQGSAARFLERALPALREGGGGALAAAARPLPALAGCALRRGVDDWEFSSESGLHAGGCEPSAAWLGASKRWLGAWQAARVAGPSAGEDPAA